MIDNAFQRFYALGYKRLLPIVPPAAPIFAYSRLRPEGLGKIPGFRRLDGTWQGFNWNRFETTPQHLEAWSAMGAGVGIRTGEGLVAFDVDSLDLELGNVAAQLATDRLGASPNRVGRHPKRLKLYRVTDDVPAFKVRFDGGLVELLSRGQQFVADGIHPVTGQPYKWHGSGPLPYDEVPLVEPAQIEELFAELVRVLPAATFVAEASGAGKGVSQASLKGSLALVQKAVRAIPNDYEHREPYIKVMHAIKAATLDEPEEGLALFHEWAETWAGGNDPGVVESDWQRAKGPFQVGAQWLYETAEARSPASFIRDEAWLPAGEAPTDLNAFELQAAVEPEQPPPLPPIEWRKPSDWAGHEPPAPEWEVRGWIPRREVTLLYGEGGVGKTLLIHQYATAAAAGVPWLNQPTRPAKVMCFFCEDSDAELHRRQVAINRALGVTFDQIEDRLRIASRKFADNILAVWDRSGAMRYETVYKQLLEDAVAWGAEVVILDTIADTFGGSEIDRKQVNSFVKTVGGRLAQAIDGSVIMLGHPSVGGRAEGRSGSTAWSNAARSRMYLRRPERAAKGTNIRELEGMKLNYGVEGAQINMEWRAGAFAAVAASSPGTDLNALKESTAAGVAAALPTIEDVTERAVLEALAKAAADRRPVNLSKYAGPNYAPRVLKREYGLDGKVDDVLLAIQALQDRKVIRLTSWLTDARNLATGYEIVTAEAGSAGGFFD